MSFRRERRPQRGRLLRFRPCSDPPSAAAPPALLHSDVLRSIACIGITFLLPRGRPTWSAPKPHSVATHCLPASVPTRSRTAGCSRNSTRLPQKAVTAVPAPSLPSHRWRQLCRTPPSNVHVPAAGPFSACCLQRLSRDCAGLRSPRFVLRLSKGPLGIGQGTPNRLWLPTFKVPLTSMWTG